MKNLTLDNIAFEHQQLLAANMHRTSEHHFAGTWRSLATMWSRVLFLTTHIATEASLTQKGSNDRIKVACVHKYSAPVLLHYGF